MEFRRRGRAFARTGRDTESDESPGSSASAGITDLLQKAEPPIPVGIPAKAFGGFAGGITHAGNTLAVLEAQFHFGYQGVNNTWLDDESIGSFGDNIRSGRGGGGNDGE